MHAVAPFQHKNVKFDTVAVTNCIVSLYPIIISYCFYWVVRSAKSGKSRQAWGKYWSQQKLFELEFFFTKFASSWHNTKYLYLPLPFANEGIPNNNCKRKRKRSDSVLWQKPLHQQKCQKGKVTKQTTPQKSSITQRLRTDLGRSVGVTTATRLVWLTGLRAHLPTNRNSRLIKRTHV